MLPQRDLNNGPPGRQSNPLVHHPPPCYIRSFTMSFICLSLQFRTPLPKILRILVTEVVRDETVEDKTQPLLQSARQLHLAVAVQALFLRFVLELMVKAKVVSLCSTNQCFRKCIYERRRAIRDKQANCFLMNDYHFKMKNRSDLTCILSHHAVIHNRAKSHALKAIVSACKY